jgi:DNA polymerase III epsilon subunit-like protein
MAVYILFDTETTGNREEDHIIQLGAMVVHSKDKIEVLDELCLAPVPITLEAMAVHHITPEMIADKVFYAETLFSSLIEEYNQPENFLIAHNINFDLSMLEKEGFENHYTLIDTLRCAKHLLPDSTNHNLQFLRYALELYKTEEKAAKEIGITIKAHDAIGDVLVMKLLLSKLVQLAKERDPSANPMQTLAELTNRPVLMKIFKFGKYKDREIAEVAQEDRSYLQWMRNNMELDEDMIFTLDSYLI